MRPKAPIIPVLIALLIFAAIRAGASEFTVILPKNSLEPRELGVVANESDPDSLALAEYYMMVRGIPEQNLVRVSFSPDQNIMDEETFRRVKAQVDAALPDKVQALALVWSRPFRVKCMSITSAFAFGFDQAYCAKGPELTRHDEYFGSESCAPFTDYGIRPAMLLAGRSVDQVMALIDRGKASDGTRPKGTGYLVETGSKNRDVRAVLFDSTIQILSDVQKLVHVKAPGIEDKHDVMFYFTGTVSVPFLETLTFLPGAVADHLTSAGGVLFGGKQMPVLDWLEAGATGSYGTVVEPYNILGKFPHPGLLMDHYLRGETLIESYWKSVAMPGQGLFVGEPLARPFSGVDTDVDQGRLRIRTTALTPGEYLILWSGDGLPPYAAIKKIIAVLGVNSIMIPEAAPGYYFIERR